MAAETVTVAIEQLPDDPSSVSIDITGNDLEVDVWRTGDRALVFIETDIDFDQFGDLAALMLAAGEYLKRTTAEPAVRSASMLVKQPVFRFHDYQE